MSQNLLDPVPSQHRRISILVNSPLGPSDLSSLKVEQPAFKSSMSMLPAAALKKPEDKTAKILDNIGLTFEGEDIEKELLKEVLESMVKEIKANGDRTH
jgi:hypothetical protein